MAGTLVISTLSDGTNSTSATNPIQGSARAWVQFNGSTGVRNSSYNVSSVTRNSTGNYTVSYTNALPNVNYVWTCFAIDSGNFSICNANSLVTNLTTSTQFNCRTTGNSQQDAGYMAISIFSS